MSTEKILIIFVVVVIVASSLAYLSSQSREGETSLSHDEVSVRAISSEEECIAAGHNWQPGGLSQQFHCVQTFSDGGTSCTSSAECEGGCWVHEKTATSGECAKNSSPFGCRATIENVRAGEPLICTD